VVSFPHPHLQYGSMVYSSLFVKCSIHVSWVDWVVNVICRDVMFFDEVSIVVDAFCAAVQDCMGIDFFSIVFDPTFKTNRRRS